MRKFIIFLCLISFTSSVKAQIDSVLANQLQNVLDESISKGNNGVSAYVLMPKGQFWNGTAGVGKQNIPITDTTVFHGASITKFNIAILMMLLVEDDLIDLDQSWNDYVSLNVDFDTSITVRQLLNHTSGIADYLEVPTSEADITSDFNHFYNPQYILENIVSGVPNFSAGTDFKYSNSNYVLVGLIIEAITGNPVHTELRNRIWNPLGMSHTYFGAYETYTEPTSGVWWDFGSGLTDYSDMPKTSMLSYAYGAGNIISCPTDLGLLLNALLSSQLLNTQSLNEMLTFVPESYNSWTAGYGLGIHNQYGQSDDRVIGHDGYYTNLSDMFHSMNYDFTLVTMSNTLTDWFGIFNPMYDVLSNYFMTTEVIEFDKKIDLTVYPNPTTSKFNITCAQIITEIEIDDMIGRVIYQANPNDKQTSITIDKDGLYLVTVKSEQGSTTSKLIVKN
ncbi:MAG: serine hydrolase [Bacteroidales bacterium]|nr:serine hydrolase [Bacteroidales bacterium]